MNFKEADWLLEKYLAGQCSEEEAARVKQWLDGYERTGSGWTDSNAEARRRRIAQGRQRLAASIAREQKELSRRRYRRISWARIAAAILLIALPAAGYFLLKKESNQLNTAEKTAALYQNDISPGTDKAILTLSDGSRIVLHDTTTDKLANQGSASISMREGGQVVYTVPDNMDPEPIVYNTVTTPKGGQFRIILPDNTKVWLNAVSSIRFPTVFSGGERKVEITGEAYFEVAENPNRPFVVTSGQQTVEVLGTYFNINSYPDENGIKTTLLKGSVKVSNGKNDILLEPGQQSIVASQSSAFTVKAVKTDLVVAWKNGFFQIENADIQTIMRQVARWYDVEIRYEGSVPEKLFSGKIRRDVNASRLLDMLTYFGVHFRIEEKKIIVIN